MDVESFVAGLRVLAVDDDRVCLKILEMQLLHCKYNVTAVTRAESALEMLRARKDGDQFDLVISDVHMPDMDGFKLLELVGLEMDIPVIMLSANEEMETMMKGIKHGACDYLVKPVHLDRLKNIWLHVVKKGMNDPRHHISGAKDDASQKHQSRDDAEDEKNGADDTKKHSRKNKKDGDGPEEDSENTSTHKRQRIQWSADLHRKFVEAVHQIGIDRAVPKKILEVMGVDGITREHVASHLQKYRLALKKLSLGTDKQPNPCPAETESWRRDWNYINMNGLDSSPSALGMHCLLHPQSVQPISSQRSLGIPVRDMGPGGHGGNLLHAAVHDVRIAASSGNSYGNISNGGLPSGSSPSGSYIGNIRNCMVLDADRSFPCIVSGNSVANISNGTQPLVPELISNSLKGGVPSMFSGCGPSQGNNLKINQLSELAASSGQMTAIGSEFQSIAALKGKSTPLVDFSEQMAPFNLGNTSSVPIYYALGSASTIRSTLPEIQIDSSDMQTQMLNGGGSSVNVPDEKDGSGVDQHAVGDLMGTSEALNEMSGDLDDFFIDLLNRDSPNGHAAVDGNRE